MQIKGMSGSASFDAGFLTFSFTEAEAKLKRNAEVTIPLEAITTIEYTAKKLLKGDRLRIRAEDVDYANDATYDPCTFVFGLESGAEFLRSLQTAINIATTQAVAGDAEVPGSLAAVSKPVVVQVGLSAAAEKAARRGKLINSFKSYTLYEKRIISSAKSWPTLGAQASVDVGASTSRISLTRVAVGGVVAGGLGAVVGGSSRRNTTKCFLTLSTSVGTVVIPYNPASETKARKFAAQVNAAGRVL
ncbi:hypothetical protein GCM10027057_25660 [Marisediminicola antarctica]|uniref:Uncharacterized protein n=2 Tax=Marisediminicola antarctica TaxID=674079 RepID=A0A7L5AJ35_9MICO|nr:DUF4429 domain-containing protein [Marisediminicola antarctica]QHO70337.1 hypothetical protein BHD05_12455 [Marisediminicola antarctica]